MKDGIYLNIPFGEYLQWPIMSQSTLKEGQKSMAHLRAAMLKERVKIPTDDMTLGSALHTAFLEPNEAKDRIAVFTGSARRGKEWEAFREDNAKRIILTANQNTQLVGMVESLRRHPEVCRWVDKIQSVETSVIGDVHGLRMKGRCDAFTTEPMIDLKKVADGDTGKFTRDAIKWGYHVQAFVYSELFGRSRFMLITVEDEPPYDVCPYEMSPGMIRQGEREAGAIIKQVLECQETGVWPGRSNVPVMLELPEWAATEPEIIYSE